MLVYVGDGVMISEAD